MIESNKLLYTDIRLILDPELNSEQCVQFKITFPKVSGKMGDINEMPPRRS